MEDVSNNAGQTLQASVSDRLGTEEEEAGHRQK